MVENEASRPVGGDIANPPGVAPPLAVLLEAAQRSGLLTTAQLADLALLTLGTATGRDRAVRYALADVTIREIAADALEAAGPAGSAAKIRALDPIVDEATARAALWEARAAARAAWLAAAAGVAAAAAVEEAAAEWAAAAAALYASRGDPARYLRFIARLVDVGVRAARGEAP